MAASSATTADRTKEQLESAVNKAHDTIEAVEERARTGIEAGRARAEQAAESIEEFEAQARETISRTSENLSRYVQEKPLQAAGIAFAAGVVATMLLRRR